MASLESALEEERQQIMALLEGNHAPVKRTSILPGERAKSPASTRSPVRSMLDVGEKPQIVRSMLDVADAPLDKSSGLSPTTSVSSVSPVTRPARLASHSPSSSMHQPLHSRSVSDASSNPPFFSASDYQNEKGHRQSYGGTLGVSSSYFGNSRKRNQIPNSKIPNSMASVIRAADEDGNPISIPMGDSAKAVGPLSRGKRASMSPAGRIGRSPSPGGMLLQPRLSIGAGKMMTDSGQILDMDSAWRRLSNTKERDRIGLSMSKNSRNEFGETMSPSGGVRLAKDYHPNEFDDALQSSDDSIDSGIDSATELDTQRGRRMTRPGKLGREADGSHDGLFSTIAMGRKDNGPRESRSLLASVEDERIKVSQTQPAYKVKSLLELPPDPTSSRRPGVHPSTSFASGSGVSTPMDSDEEADLRDIKRAQRLDLALSPIMSTPESHRAIRTITRGDFKKTQQEVAIGSRRERMYLVATDLSDEAMYALEWTIGTVLRDGDTLLCVYAIDEENGVNTAGLSIGDGGLAVKDHDEILGTLEKKPSRSAATYISPLNPAVGGILGSTESATTSPDGRVKSKDEQDRYRATEDITQKCVRLLRKTKLQVKVVVEVFHCKSPRHLICEVIDFMEPTLVVLGSRGRSALKGVLLGSFSNYLVMKSSVPVMVARRKLRKPSKSKRPVTAHLGVNNSGGLHVRLSNNLTGLAQGMPKSKLDYAIIDK